MIRNYLTVAVRNLMRHLGYTVINISSLAIGLVCVILTGLFIHHEFRFDRWHSDIERIYRVVKEVKLQNSPPKFYEGVGGAIVPVLAQTYPEVEEAIRMCRVGVWGRVGEQTSLQMLSVVEPGFFDFFDFPMAKGNHDALFAQPGLIFITESMAHKYYGQKDAMGQVMAIEEGAFTGDYIVGGILKDPPETSSLVFHFMISAASVSEMPWRWHSWATDRFSSVDVYIRIKEGASVASILGKLYEGMKANRGDEAASQIRHHLQPLSRKYLHSFADYGFRSGGLGGASVKYGDIQYVRISLLVAAFILVIACLNFMNLATARSAGRKREVGMRKVVGAYRRQLIGQFLGEAVVFAFIALGLALMITWAVLPSFNELIERSLRFGNLGQMDVLFGLLGGTFLIGVMAGSYPALFLSKFQPLAVLKVGQMCDSKRNFLRKGLVAFQFAISIFMIVATVVVHQQLHFVQTKDLGFDREQIVILPIFWLARSDATHGRSGFNLKQRYNQVKTAFLQYPTVKKVGASRFYLQDDLTHFDYVPEGGVRPQRLRTFGTEEDFFAVYDIPFVSGRTFGQAFVEIHERHRWRNDMPEYFVINEAAVRHFGWTNEQAVGKTIDMVGRTRGSVIGVIKDFHIQTLHNKVEPVVFIGEFGNMKVLHAKIDGRNIQETLTFFESTWKRFLPNRPFTYAFLDEKLDSYYHTERKQGDVFQTFALVAIFVACLGLFGLAAFTAEQRTKEMGIRKVMGATESRLVFMLTGEFTKLVLIANVIAWPAAYWMMDKWLAGFVYRIDLAFAPFVLSGILAFVVALGTVSYQAWKAARSNPIEALRHE